jgi:hypothetical protein
MYKTIFFITLFIASHAQAKSKGSFGVAAEAGMSVAPVSSYGLDLFFNEENYTYGLNVHKGSLDFIKYAEDNADGSSSALDRFDVDTTLLLLQGRWFFLWGLNLSGGVGLRAIDITYEISDQSNSLSGVLKTQSVVTNIGLGVHGRFDSFYLGLQILGITTPLSTDVESEAKTSGPIASFSNELKEFNEDMLDIGKKLGSVQSAQLAIFALGWIF